MAANFSTLLHPINLHEQVCLWLKEDTPSFDYGGFVVGNSEEKAVIICKAAGELAGTVFVDAIFGELGCTVTWFAQDGNSVSKAMKVATVTGPVNKLLLGERVALNCLSRCSGVTKYAKQLKQISIENKWHGTVAGTRKTTPGFRMVEKYGLQVAGVDTHRYDLSSMVMLKDNHIWAVGSITTAVEAARSVCGFSMKIEVECRSLEEGCEAARAGADVVMFDNFQPQALHKAAEEFKNQFSHVIVEASGGITEETLSAFMGPHVDVISMGKCTQGYDVVPYSMKILKSGHDPNNPPVTTA